MKQKKKRQEIKKKKERRCVICDKLRHVADENYRQRKMKMKEPPGD